MGTASSPCVQPREGVPSGGLRGAAKVGLPFTRDLASRQARQGPLWRQTKPRLWSRSRSPAWSWSIGGVAAQNPRCRSGWSGGRVAPEVPAGPQTLLPGCELRGRQDALRTVMREAGRGVGGGRLGDEEETGRGGRGWELTAGWGCSRPRCALPAGLAGSTLRTACGGHTADRQSEKSKYRLPASGKKPITSGGWGGRPCFPVN